MTGTGMLSGYTYAVDIPLAIVEHTAPRTAGKPVQQFECDLFQLAGQITGDPLFDLLRVVSGSDSGHPCPGITTLTQLSGGDWHVDSFFDVFFEVEFAGAPGGPLAGLSGVSTDTVRTQQGEPYPWEHCDVFNIVFSPAGEFLSGGGGGWNGDGAGPWYYYPNTDWWNEWYYDGLLDLDRYKDVWLRLNLTPTGPASSATIAVNYSNIKETKNFLNIGLTQIY